VTARHHRPSYSSSPPCSCAWGWHCGPGGWPPLRMTAGRRHSCRAGSRCGATSAPATQRSVDLKLFHPFFIDDIFYVVIVFKIHVRSYIWGRDSKLQETSYIAMGLGRHGLVLLTAKIYFFLYLL
jgi:hypothetical protein